MKKYVVVDPTDETVYGFYDTLQEAQAETEGDHLHNCEPEAGVAIYELVCVAHLKAAFTTVEQLNDQQ